MDEKYQKQINSKDFKREPLFRQVEKKTEKLKVTTKKWAPPTPTASSAPA